jgi:hypothetical protein
MTTPAGSFPLGPVLDGRTGGELVQSLTYREAYSPGLAHLTSVYGPPARHRQARPFRAAAGAAWALVSIAAAGCVLVVLVLVLVRLVGWLT